MRLPHHMRLRWKLVAVLLLGLLTLGRAALTALTYNVENYLVAGRMVDSAFHRACPKPENEKATLQRTLYAIDTDVIALQKMGSKPFLEELQREGLDYPFAYVLETGDPDRPAAHVVMLAKIHFKRVRTHALVPIKLFDQPDPDHLKCGVLEVTFTTDVGGLTFFVVHLKSRRTERPNDPEGTVQCQQEAEAARDVELSTRLFPKSNCKQISRLRQLEQCYTEQVGARAAKTRCDRSRRAVAREGFPR